MPKTRRGGRNAGSSGININADTTSLISERERQREEVDLTLTVLRDVEREHDVILEDVQLARIKGRSGAGVMAYYDAEGNLAVNEKYFDREAMDAAYDGCVASGFHPGRGSKTGLEAVVAHEMGHRLTDIAARNAGMGFWALDDISNNIIKAAAKSLKMAHGNLRSAVSGYAQHNNAECVAEAYADVYCNGSKASAASRAVVAELRKYL